MKVLVIDVGGSHVKLMMGRGRKQKFESGPKMTPARMVAQVKKATTDWKFDAISLGLPTPIVHGRPAVEPQNLGRGWRRFDFEQALGKPVKIVNDAAMQALGSYEGGRMLFIGLGTGLGSALILDDVLVPLELGELNFSSSRTLEQTLGKAALKRLGRPKWEKNVHAVVDQLRKAFVADYVMLGGGNAKKLTRLPADARRGKNENAYLGGVRLWRSPRSVRRKKHTLELAEK